MIKGSSVYYYSKDGLGSVVNLTDSTGTSVESYTYDEYGNLTSAPSQIGNRYLYTGREYDPEINLYYYRARYYDPSIGRFLQTDPIGYEGGVNLYTYVNNNPLNWIDPFGFGKLKKDLSLLEKLQRYLNEVGAEMEKGYMTNMQGLIGIIGVGAGAYSNIGSIPKGIGYSNRHFIEGGRISYRWANQYGSGIKPYSFTQLGPFGSALSIISAGMTGWTVGEVINAYYWGYQNYRENYLK